MTDDSSSAVYPRFAVSSFLAIALIAVLFALLGAPMVRRANERAAAHSASAVAAAPLRGLFAPLAPGAPVPDDVRFRAQALVDQSIAGDLKGVRVWGPDGRLIVAAGVGAAAPKTAASGSGITWERATAPDRGGLFVTFARVGTYTIEVDQSVRGIDAAVAEAYRGLAVLVAVLALACFVLVQATFWAAVRSLSARHRKLVHLQARGDAMRSSLDVHEVVTQVSRDATLLADGGFGLVALYDEASGDLMLRSTFLRATDETVQHQRPVEEWFLRRCVVTNTTITATQPATAYRQFFGPEMETAGQLALICAPLAMRDRVAGVVAVARIADRRGGAFSADAVQAVERLAAQGVAAVEQAILFAKVRSYADEIELSYDATLKALMAALDAKDEVTEGHCERVAKMTLHLARSMGMPEPQLVDIERGALLHDVGKIGVPDAVLQKPSALNDGEWEAMRKHPLLAALMVSKIGFLEGAMPILLYHHERYDGAGYPFGLMADKIPLEARIFSVIDAYDAMTSDRPYRLAMSHEDAMAEVISNSDTQFDPDVVTAFQELMEARPDLQHVIVRPDDAEGEDGEAPPPVEDAA
jgi:HD-GYP domain-containing protein (c-di-GMP phosphodiesterase class II)